MGELEEREPPAEPIPPAVPSPAPPPDSATAEGPPEAALPSEEAQLSQLARLNATDKPRALALALSMDDVYPRTGPNAEARRAMIITLLVDLGRIDEARQRVPRYIEAYPDSPYLPIVEGKTGIHPRPSGPRH